MNENEILLDNISGEVMDYIRQLKFKTTKFGGYDKNYVQLNMQEICNIYEKHIAMIYSENKSHIDTLNNEIFELRQKNDSMQRRSSIDPALIARANKAIEEANSRIEEANQRIARLQSMYEESQTRIKSLELENAQLISKKNLEDADYITSHAKEEAERIRSIARSEAEAIIRERRAEIRAEERYHEERLEEIKERYTKYRRFFDGLAEEVRKVEAEIGPLNAKG